MNSIYLSVWPCRLACEVFLPQPGIEPISLAVKAQNHSHRITREFPGFTPLNVHTEHTAVLAIPITLYITPLVLTDLTIASLFVLFDPLHPVVPLHSPPQFSSVAQSCLTLCDPMDCSTPGLPVHHQLPEFTQTHVH